jgi:hypothetical protein
MDGGEYLGFRREGAETYLERLVVQLKPSPFQLIDSRSPRMLYYLWKRVVTPRRSR